MLARRAYMCRSRLAEKPPEIGSRRWLVAELDKYTSLIVRRRDRRCGACGEPRGLQCSHFYSRRHSTNRFDLRNCNAQCVMCNRLHHTDPLPYRNYMQAAYGTDVLAELNGRRTSLRKVSEDELKELLNQYKAAV